MNMLLYLKGRTLHKFFFVTESRCSVSRMLRTKSIVSDRYIENMMRVFYLMSLCSFPGRYKNQLIRPTRCEDAISLSISY